MESFKFLQKNKGFEIFAFVILSNHIHLLVRSLKGDLSGSIRDFKNFTSKKFLSIVNSDVESRSDGMKIVFEYHGKYKNKQTYQVWTHENHAELIYSQKFIEQKVNYIYKNPVKSGIVVKSEDYLYSSARNYAGLDNLLNIVKVDFLWKTI